MTARRRSIFPQSSWQMAPLPSCHETVDALVAEADRLAPATW